VLWLFVPVPEKDCVEFAVLGLTRKPKRYKSVESHPCRKIASKQIVDRAVFLNDHDDVLDFSLGIRRILSVSGDCCGCGEYK